MPAFASLDRPGYSVPNLPIDSNLPLHGGEALPLGLLDPVLVSLTALVVRRVVLGLGHPIRTNEKRAYRYCLRCETSQEQVDRPAIAPREAPLPLRRHHKQTSSAPRSHTCLFCVLAQKEERACPQLVSLFHWVPVGLRRLQERENRRALVQPESHRACAPQQAANSMDVELVL